MNENGNNGYKQMLFLHERPIVKMDAVLAPPYVYMICLFVCLVSEPFKHRLEGRRAENKISIKIEKAIFSFEISSTPVMPRKSARRYLISNLRASFTVAVLSVVLVS